MPLPHMAFLVQPRPLHHYSCIHLWPALHTTIDCSDNQVVAAKLCCHSTPLRCSTISLAVSGSVAKQYPLGEVVADEAREYRDEEMHLESSFCSNSHYNEQSHESGTLSCHSEEVLTCSMKELKETLRRRRIGLANKGRVPWNKGRKHSAETCARIKERTLEAMRDPKVRKKMSESPRVHSEQSKKKIGSSIRQLWAERLKWRRSREKFVSSWAASIAEAARMGGINEERLNWDSYEKLKEEIDHQNLKKDVEKAKRKEMKKIQVENRAQERVKNKAQRALKVLDSKHMAKPRAKKKAVRSHKRRRKNNDIAGTMDLSLKPKRTKIQGKKLANRPICTQSAAMNYLHAALEKFDIESIKEEQKRKAMSLAEQIQVAKSKRHELSLVDPQ